MRDAAGRQLAGGKLPRTTVPVGSAYPLGRIEANLAGIKTARQLTLTLALPGKAYRNTWHIWVYPAAVPDAAGEVVFTQSTEEALRALAQGKKVLLNPDYREMVGLEGKFVPVFWSPVHFPAQAHHDGAALRPQAPGLARLPHGVAHRLAVVGFVHQVYHHDTARPHVNSHSAAD